ncbi:MAG: ABC transporter ATP-binding protein [Bacteroidetes bacterium]|nr:ABC transporter ATP-binding protein [Bacteroidota bacterium]MBL6964619.1 ABC transporter ATP-binding protein [Bacteroidota bacterium]
MIIKVENIAKSFRKKIVLRDVNFNMEKGSLCGIVGENGTGKSTILRIIVGECKADSGNVYVDGKLGYCPQNTLLFSQLTVDEHFHYFSAAYGIGKDELYDHCEELMIHFNYKQFKNEKIANLSGGTKQKLNLSIALISQPDLLILDEPYNGFDWDTYLMFWDYTARLQEKGCAILVVTHMLSEKERFDRIYNLENGYLV